MTRAVIYCRCSTEEESQQDALKQQAAESRQCVRQQGWILVDEYIEAKSGTTTIRRDEYNRLYDELQTDKFDVIVIKSQDRLMRNTKDWYLFIDRLVTNGKRLFMYLEAKFYSADDALITGIKAILAEEYSRELSKKINNAHSYRQRAGRSFILPPRTYGLKKNPDGSIILLQEEAEAIRIMFFLCKSMGCTSIRHYLEENGIRDRNGKIFSEETIRRIIRNPIRYGTIIQNKRHFDFQARKTVQVPKEQWIIHENAVPAVVSKSDWLEANAAMDRRRESLSKSGNSPRGRNPGKYQLSGKIRCGECGSPYYRRCRKRNLDKRPAAEWKCRKYIQNGRSQSSCKSKTSRNAEPSQGCDNIHLEEERLLHLLERTADQYYGGLAAGDSGIADKAMAVLSEVLKQNDSTEQMTRLKKEAERLREQNNRLLDKLLDEVITDKDYKERKADIGQKIEIINRKMEKLKNTEKTRLDQEQRLHSIRKKLEERVVRQAELAVMIDNIEEIRVFPDSLTVIYKTKRNITVPLGPEFRHAARKEEENRRILDYMHENPRITAKMIAEIEGISLSAANARIRRLKRQGRIRFNGRGGHGEWISDIVGNLQCNGNCEIQEDEV